MTDPMFIVLWLAVVILSLQGLYWTWPRRKKSHDFPRPPNSIYDTRECPDCGFDKFDTHENGGSHGYEVRFRCQRCHTSFGLNLSVRTVDRLGYDPRWEK